MRNLTRLKNEKEKDLFIQEVFRNSIKGEHLLPDGTVKFNMEFILDNKVKVCRKSFAAAYGVSVKYLERCSSAFKKSDSKRVYTVNNFRTYRDDTLHNYNYAETEELIKLNLRTEYIGIIDKWHYTYYS
jgi:DNA uptake protein ComE-like DNA-binding protein